MHQKVEPPPTIGNLREQRIEARLGADIRLDHEIALQALGQGPHPLSQRVALIGKGEPGALRMRCLGNAPGDRALIGDAHDEALFSGHHGHFVLLPPRLGWRGPGRRPLAASYTKPVGPASDPPISCT